MNLLANRFLSSVNHYTGRIGLLDSAVMAILDRVAPKATAKACTQGVTCYSYCGDPMLGCRCGTRYRGYSLSGDCSQPSECAFCDDRCPC